MNRLRKKQVEQSVGGPGAGVAEGIRVRYTGENAPEGQTAGTVTFMQNSLEFHIGHNVNHRTKVSFNSVKAATLGSGIKNDSGFKSLADINLMDGQKAMDSMQVIDRAIEEVAATRGRMGAFQKNTLESNLNFLRIAKKKQWSLPKNG